MVTMRLEQLLAGYRPQVEEHHWLYTRITSALGKRIGDVAQKTIHEFREGSGVQRLAIAGLIAARFLGPDRAARPRSDGWPER